MFLSSSVAMAGNVSSARAVPFVALRRTMWVWVLVSMSLYLCVSFPIKPFPGNASLLRRLWPWLPSLLSPSSSDHGSGRRVQLRHVPACLRPECQCSPLRQFCIYRNQISQYCHTPIISPTNTVLLQNIPHKKQVRSDFPHPHFSLCSTKLLGSLPYLLVLVSSPPDYSSSFSRALYTGFETLLKYLFCGIRLVIVSLLTYRRKTERQRYRGRDREILGKKETERQRQRNKKTRRQRDREIGRQKGRETETEHCERSREDRTWTCFDDYWQVAYSRTSCLNCRLLTMANPRKCSAMSVSSVWKVDNTLTLGKSAEENVAIYFYCYCEQQNVFFLLYLVGSISFSFSPELLQQLCKQVLWQRNRKTLARSPWYSDILRESTRYSAKHTSRTLSRSREGVERPRIRHIHPSGRLLASCQ